MGMAMMAERRVTVNNSVEESNRSVNDHPQNRPFAENREPRPAVWGVGKKAKGFLQDAR